MDRCIEKRKYTRVPDDKRSELLQVLTKISSIKEAAKIVNINYENAKAILRIWRRERRSKLSTRWASKHKE